MGCGSMRLDATCSRLSDLRGTWGGLPNVGYCGGGLRRASGGCLDLGMLVVMFCMLVLGIFKGYEMSGGGKHGLGNEGFDKSGLEIIVCGCVEVFTK